MNFPGNLRYTKDHEWISLEGDIATIGITQFAQSELGDIVYVDIETIGSALEAETVFGTVQPAGTGEPGSLRKRLDDQNEGQ